MRRLRVLVFSVLLGAFLAVGAPVLVDKQLVGVQIIPGSEIAYAQENCDDGITGSERNCTLAERISDPNGYVYETWVVVRGIINIILIIALLAISFSNITRVSIDTYTIKKALPNLLVGVVLANASMFIIRYMADLSTVMIYFFVEQSGTVIFKAFLVKVVGAISIETFMTLGAAIMPIAGIVLLIVGLIVLIGTLWLALILYIRLAVIYLLTILAPVAFVAYGIPGMDKYFKQWWQQFVKWMFMLPAMCAVFWLMLEIQGSGEQSILKVVTMYILFFFALAIPSKFGGSIVDKTTNAFKKYSGADATKKWAGESASQLGQLAVARSPIGRIQEWAKLNKANMEKRISNARLRQSVRARKGRAGLTEGRLAGEEQGFNDDLATRKAQNQESYFKTPDGQKMLKGLIESEVKKREAEANRDNQRLEMKIEFMGKKEDTTEGKLVKRLHEALFKQKRATDILELDEGIAVGEVAFASVEAVRVIDDYKKHGKAFDKAKKEYDALSQEDKDSEDGIAKFKHMEALEKAKETAVDSFKSMKGNPRYAKELGEFSNIDEALKEFNNDDSTKAKLWKATLSRGSKIVNEGLSKQNEEILKNGTATEITSMMEEFMSSIDEAFESAADSAKAKKLFMQGKTADLQLMVDKLSKGKQDKFKIRDGLLAAEANKVLLARTGDYRNEEVAKHYIGLHNEHGAESDAEMISVEGLSDRKTRTSAIQNLVSESGSLMGPGSSKPRATKVRPPKKAKQQNSRKAPDTLKEMFPEELGEQTSTQASPNDETQTQASPEDEEAELDDDDEINNPT